MKLLDYDYQIFRYRPPDLRPSSSAIDGVKYVRASFVAIAYYYFLPSDTIVYLLLVPTAIRPSRVVRRPLILIIEKKQFYFI